MIKKIAKVLELLGDRLEVCVSVLDSIYHMTLKLLSNHIFAWKHLDFAIHVYTWRYYGRQYMTLPKPVNC